MFGDVSVYTASTAALKRVICGGCFSESVRPAAELARPDRIERVETRIALRERQMRGEVRSLSRGSFRVAPGTPVGVSDERSQPLHEQDVTDDPLRLFGDWYERARADEENASFMSLATADPAGRPSVRTVQLEGFDQRGFVFYTGYESRKGRELAENPQAALCFYWHGSGHQVRVEGAVVRAPLDRDEAERAARAAESTEAHQSEGVADLRDLEARVAELRARYGDDAPPLPGDWGGHRLVPDAYEFWQYREDKLHDRFRYRLAARAGWEIERLFP